MGAQSDFVTESFAPGDDYRAKQIAVAMTLLATGMSPEQVAARLSIPLESFTDPSE